MESTVRFLLVCLIGACSALYPNPNYESIVTPVPETTVPPKPAVEYGVPFTPETKVRPTPRPKTPEVEYGLPHVRVPSIVYGVPTRSFDFDITDVVEKTKVPAKPSQTYGVPQPQVPSTSYGVPVQRVPVPKKTVVSYVVPSRHSLDFDLDGGDGADDEDVVFEIPSSSLEVPKPEKPGTAYGVPVVRSTTPSTQYGVPTTARSVVPARTYGVPHRKIVPFETYELPKVRVPAVVYGVPPKPSEEYGVPNVKVPAREYGLF